MSAKTREWFVWSISELSPKGKQMFKTLRDSGKELSLKEWVGLIDKWREAFNGNERRQLEKLLNHDLVLRDTRLIEFERVRPEGWGGPTGDDWHNLTVEWSHRGRFYVYMVNPEALEALEAPPEPTATTPASAAATPASPRMAAAMAAFDKHLADINEDFNFEYTYQESVWERMAGAVLDFAAWCWKILQTP